MADQLLEAHAPADFLGKVQALHHGESARLKGGVVVHRVKTPDDRDSYRVGGPSRYGNRFNGEDYEGPHHGTADEAVKDAFRRSAQSSEPESIGGTNRVATYGELEHEGSIVRPDGFDTDGKLMVRDRGGAVKKVNPDHVKRRGLFEALEEREVGKPGTNWKQVSPENRKKIDPIVKHYMKDPHPFTACVRDGLKHGWPQEKANRICAVVKDMGMRTTKWRAGGKKLTEADEAWEAVIAPALVLGGVTVDELAEAADTLAAAMDDANPKKRKPTKQEQAVMQNLTEQAFWL